MKALFCHKNFIKLPSSSTIIRHLGVLKGTDNLIKERLCAELENLRHPAQGLCSLIIDMSIKGKIIYTRAEDHIHVLDSNSRPIGSQPKFANKMACFVINGLSASFDIPAGFFFHSTLQAAGSHSLTLQVIKLLTDCGFLVLHIVTDNHPSNVGLLKNLCGGILTDLLFRPPSSLFSFF